MPGIFFIEMQKSILKSKRNLKRSKQQNNLEKEELSWRTDTPNFKTHYEATIVKAVWYWHEDRHIDQQDRIESPEINPYLHSQLSFDKCSTFYSMGKELSLQQMALKQLHVHMQKNESSSLGPFSSAHLPSSTFNSPVSQALQNSLPIKQ